MGSVRPRRRSSCQGGLPQQSRGLFELRAALSPPHVQRCGAPARSILSPQDVVEVLRSSDLFSSSCECKARCNRKAVRLKVFEGPSLTLWPRTLAPLTVASLGIGRPACLCSWRLTIGTSSFRPVGLAGAIIPALPHSRTVHRWVYGLGADIVRPASLRPFSPKTSWLGTPTIVVVPKWTHILERMCGGQIVARNFRLAVYLAWKHGVLFCV